MKFPRVAKPLMFGAALMALAYPAFAESDQVAIVKHFYEAFNKHDTSLFDKALAKDWVDEPMNLGQGPGLEGFKPVAAGFDKIFGDMQIVPQDFIEQGDKVVVRSLFTGKQIGDFAGIPATGKPISIMTIDIHQIKDGKVVKTWHLENWMAAMAQLGAFGK